MESMQKVYIKGVQGRGNEVIAKLEALGGKNAMGLSGDYDYFIYCIDVNGIIRNIPINNLSVITTWSGTEIFLDEPKGEPKGEPKPESVNTLKMYDSVMVSDDGKHWDIGFYESEDYVTIGADIEGRISYCFDYIVPLFDFDFNDLYSNIKRSIV